MTAKTEKSDMCRHGTKRHKADSKNTRETTVSK